MTSTNCDVAFTFTYVSIVVPVLGCHSLHVKGRDNQSSRGRAGKVGPSAKVPPVTAFLVCNGVKTTVVVFTAPSGDIM